MRGTILATEAPCMCLVRGGTLYGATAPESELSSPPVWLISPPWRTTPPVIETRYVRVLLTRQRDDVVRVIPRLRLAQAQR